MIFLVARLQGAHQEAAVHAQYEEADWHDRRRLRHHADAPSEKYFLIVCFNEFQVAHEILTNPEDKTKVSLVFANVSVDDILLKKQIDGWKAKYEKFINNTFSVCADGF